MNDDGTNGLLRSETIRDVSPRARIELDSFPYSASSQVVVKANEYA
jgi:hypothetical protein